MSFFLTKHREEIFFFPPGKKTPPKRSFLNREIFKIHKKKKNEIGVADRNLEDAHFSQTGVQDGGLRREAGRMCTNKRYVGKMIRGLMRSATLRKENL